MVYRKIGEELGCSETLARLLANPGLYDRHCERNNEESKRKWADGKAKRDALKKAAETSVVVTTESVPGPVVVPYAKVLLPQTEDDANVHDGGAE
jgi:hypothetical protein